MAFASVATHNPSDEARQAGGPDHSDILLRTTGGVMTADKARRLADVYWRVLSPLIHHRGARLVLLALLTAVLVFVPTFLRTALLTFHVIP
jgi:hypothetical protein